MDLLGINHMLDGVVRPFNTNYAAAFRSDSSDLSDQLLQLIPQDEQSGPRFSITQEICKIIFDFVNNNVFGFDPSLIRFRKDYNLFYSFGLSIPMPRNGHHIDFFQVSLSVAQCYNFNLLACTIVHECCNIAANYYTSNEDWDKSETNESFLLWLNYCSDRFVCLRRLASE